MIKWIVLWLLAGILSCIIMCIGDMRGEKYDPYYFKNSDMISCLIILLICGVMSLILVIITLIIFKHQENVKKHPDKSITKKIYNLANIGLKTNQEEADETDI